MTFALVSPVADLTPRSSFLVEGRGRFLIGRQPEPPGRKFVGPAFAAVVGATVLAGRDLAWEDARTGRRVALVDQTMAHTFWGEESPLGSRLRFRLPLDPSEESAEVVGIVTHMRHGGFRASIKPEVYLSLIAERIPSTSIHISHRLRS